MRDYLITLRHDVTIVFGEFAWWRIMFRERTKWTGRRFGEVKNLGKIKDVKTLVWPDIKKIVIEGEDTLTYKLVDITEAERMAEIYRNGADEVNGNSDREWHCSIDGIIEKYNTGDWNFYGCYLNDLLVSVTSMFVFRGQKAIQWVMGTVDPLYRGRGVWRHMGEYLDEICRLSNAQIGFAWAVTTHPYSQMSLESAGYTPMGFFPGWSLYGGSDGQYYRTSAVLYGKVYDGSHVQEESSVILTESARKIVEAVC